MKSIPFLTKGMSLSLIISERAFTTVIFIFGNCFSIISFCLFSSCDLNFDFEFDFEICLIHFDLFLLNLLYLLREECFFLENFEILFLFNSFFIFFILYYNFIFIKNKSHFSITSFFYNIIQSFTIFFSAFII